MYFTIRRRFSKQSIEDLREDVKRKEDARSTALSLTEFVDKHGEADWADHMLSTLGTWYMVQLGDVNDLIESTLKYINLPFTNPTVISC